MAKQANYNKFGNTVNRQSNKYGGRVEWKRKTQLVDIAAASTTSSTITIPANCALEGITFRVVKAVSGTTGSTMDVGITGTTTAFFNDVVMDTAGTTGIKHVANVEYTAAKVILITPISTPSAGGKIRFTLYYKQITAPKVSK